MRILKTFISKIVLLFRWYELLIPLKNRFLTPSIDLIISSNEEITTPTFDNASPSSKSIHDREPFHDHKMGHAAHQTYQRSASTQSFGGDIAIKVELNDLRDKDFVERQLFLTKQYCLSGLSEKSTLPQIVERMEFFAERTQSEYCRVLYEWAAEIHGKEVMLAKLFMILSRSSIAVDLTDYIFAELKSVNAVDPINAAEWIHVHFYGLSKESLAHLLQIEGVVPFIKDELFMQLVVCEQYEKALLLYEAGVRIHRKAQNVTIKTYHYDSGDTVVATMNYQLNEERKGMAPLTLLTSALEHKVNLEASKEKRRLAIQRFFAPMENAVDELLKSDPNTNHLGDETAIVSPLNSPVGLYQSEEEALIEAFEKEEVTEDLTDMNDKEFLIVVEKGPQEYLGDEWLIEHPETSIGREASAHIYFNEQTVSRRQLVLYKKGNHLCLKNMSKTIQTLVNGEKAASNTLIVIAHGDIIEFSNLRLRILAIDCHSSYSSDH